MGSFMQGLLSSLILCTLFTQGNSQTTVTVDPVKDTNWFLPLNVPSTEPITCSVTGDDKAKVYFRVYPNTCLLTYKTSLEADPSTFRYDVTVEYFPTSDPTNVSSLTVTVYAQRNLNTPRFISTSYTANVEDSEPAGSSVILVAAMDGDFSPPANTIQYQFAQHTDFFEINGLTGEIRIKQKLSLDVTRPAFYRLVTLAVDQGSRPLTGTTTVMVNVSWNKAPVFTTKFYSSAVSESSRVLQDVIIQVSALDNDNPTSPNGQVSYSISTDAANRVFHMNESSGEITSRVDLKSAPSTSWAFDVTATDGGSPPLSDTAKVNINIMSAGVPQFLPSEYEMTVSESMPLGATVLTVMARDPTQAELEYELIGDGLATSYFSVNSSTGAITVKTLLSQDSTYTLAYHLRVKASRKSDATAHAEGRVVINVVRNANSPSFPSSNYVYNVTETFPLWQIIATFAASDSDSGPAGTVEYSIDRSSFRPSNAFTYFFINPTTGQLLLTSSLAGDPQTTQYRFSVVARDRGVPSRASSVQVLVNVPRNPSSPAFTPDRYTKTVAESFPVNQPVITVSASDNDGDLVRYLLTPTPPDSLYFNIDPSTGQIVVGRPFIADTAMSYRLTVVAVDNGVPPRSSTASVQVNVVRNPSSPVFQSHASSLNISSYTTPGTVVTRLLATDADSPSTPSGQLRYSMDQKNDYFSVNPSTGDVFTIAPFTTSVSPIRFPIRVVVSDGSVVPKSATTEVVIMIVGNQHAPVFQGIGGDTVVVDGAGQPYRILYTVTATDADRTDPYNGNTPDAEVGYAIMGPLEARRLFRISETGDVYMVQPLDRSSVGNYSIDVVIRASDKGWNPKFSEMTLNVTFVIDQQPIGTAGEIGFRQPVYYVTVRENQMSTDILMLDLENLGTARPRCSILSGNSLYTFAVQLSADGKGCMLTRSGFGSLDAEQQNSYQLRVRVEPDNLRRRRAVGDSCTFNSWREIDIFVTVTDVNDNQPMFIYPQQPVSYQNTYFAAISSSAKPLTHVIRVQAQDYDSGSQGTVTYSLDTTGASTPLPFFISPKDGEIKTALEFDQMSPRQYQVTVRARDSPPMGTPLHSDANLVVNLIEDFNRFILTVNNRTTKDMIGHYEDITQQLQKSYGHPVLIERIQARRQASLHGVTVYPDSTDIIFVIVGDKADNYQLLNNTNQATVGRIMSDETQSQVKANIKTIVNLDVEDVLAGTMTSSTLGTTTAATRTTTVKCEFPRRDINSAITHGSVPIYTALLSLIGYWLAH